MANLENNISEHDFDVTLGFAGEGKSAFLGISNLFFCLYQVDFVTGEFDEVFSRAKMRETLGSKGNAAAALRYVGDNFVIEKYRAAFREFADLGSLASLLSRESVVRFECEGASVGWCRLLVMPCDWDECGAVTGALFAARMIQDEKQREIAREAALREARTDALTGVRNRRAYLDEANKWTDAIATGSCEPFAVAVFDVNHLKQVNDTFGHERGDAYILSAKDAICTTFTHSPVFRIGGDEFVAIISGRDYDNRISLVAQFRQISGSNEIASLVGGTGVLSAIGMSDYRAGFDKSFSAVFNRADERMYLDKMSARNVLSVNADTASASVRPDMGAALMGNANEGQKTRRRVLVIEDNDFVRSSLVEELSGAYSIVEAADGLAGLENLRTYASELSAVVLNLNMPGMDGFEFLSIVESDALLKQVPIIVSATDVDLQVEQRCMDLGASEFLYRPYSQSTLHRRLDAVIQKAESESLLGMVEIDSYTGFYRRHAFVHHAREFVAQAAETDSITVFAMSLLGADAVEELYGPKGFSAALNLAAKIMRDNMTGEHLLCHVGGGRFLGLCYSDDAHDRGFLQKIQQSVHEIVPAANVVVKSTVAPHVFKGDTVAHAVSAVEDGIARIAHDPLKSVSVVTRDDVAQMARQEELVVELAAALDNNEFDIYLQPKCRLSDGSVIGAEALVRRVKPDGEVLGPATFIPVMEKNGLITQLDLLVWERTFAAMADWIDKGLNPPPVSMNVSRIDIVNTSVFDIFEDLSRRYNVPRDRVEVEITESAYISNEMHVKEEEQAFRQAGYRVLIDDFGSGYSSLSMLKDADADILKLDMRFLQGDEQNFDKSVGIIRSVVDMAHDLGMLVIVEGVETQAQRDALLALGCTYAQGYFFYRPMPRDEYEALISDSGKVGEVADVLEAGRFAARRRHELNRSITLTDDTGARRIVFSMLDLLEGMPGGLLIYEANDSERILYANTEMQRLCGCESDDAFMTLSGGTFAGLVYADDVSRVKRSLERQDARGGDPAENHPRLDFVKYRMKRLDGSTVWVHDFGRKLTVDNFGSLFVVFVSPAFAEA